MDAANPWFGFKIYGAVSFWPAEAQVDEWLCFTRVSKPLRLGSELIIDTLDPFYRHSAHPSIPSVTGVFNSIYQPSFNNQL